MVDLSNGGGPVVEGMRKLWIGLSRSSFQLAIR